MLLVGLQARARAKVPVPSLEEVAAEPGWLALGHWQEQRFGPGWRSDLEPAPFFLAATGRESPLAELQATVAALADGATVGPERLPAPCAFPARAAFLRRRGYPVKEVACPELAAFTGKLAARSATLIFASAYANNPASMFGHVALRLNHEPLNVLSTSAAPALPAEQGRLASLRLLNNAIGFLAQLSADDDPFTYTYKGITGGYPGAFMVDPYYVTVAIYNDGESRDLWEYDLQLNEAEVALLVGHLWELAKLARFRYFFAHGNCAYYILSLLDAARPAEHLLEATPAIVLPLEVARRVHAQLGSPTPVRWRPSLKRQLRLSLEQLSSEERGRFDRLRAGLAPIAGEDAAVVLDALIAYLNFKKFDSHNQLSEVQRQALRAALVRRSQVPNGEQGVAAPSPPVAPDAGHLPAMLRLGGGERERIGFYSLGFKAGLHDPLSDSGGYESFASIDYLDGELRYQPAARRWSLDRFTVIAVNSLIPIDLVSRVWSWRAELAWLPITEAPGAHQARGELGGGGTFGLYGEHLNLYGLILATVDVSAWFSRGLRTGPGIALGLSGQAGRYHVLGEWAQRRDLIAGKDSGELRLAQSWVFSRAWEVRATWSLAQGRNESGQQRERQLVVAHSF